MRNKSERKAESQIQRFVCKTFRSDVDGVSPGNVPPPALVHTDIFHVMKYIAKAKGETYKKFGGVKLRQYR